MCPGEEDIFIDVPNPRPELTADVDSDDYNIFVKSIQLWLNDRYRKLLSWKEMESLEWKVYKKSFLFVVRTLVWTVNVTQQMMVFVNIYS